MDVLKKVDTPVHQWNAERSQDIVPIRLHVFRSSALGITFTAKIIITRCYNVRNEVVIAT